MPMYPVAKISEERVAISIFLVSIFIKKYDDNEAKKNVKTLIMK